MELNGDLTLSGSGYLIDLIQFLSNLVVILLKSKLLKYGIPVPLTTLRHRDQKYFSKN